MRYFASAAEAAGREEELVERGDGTLASLRARLSERYGAEMQRVLRSGSFLVEGTVRRDDGPIATGGGGASHPPTVDVLPPFAGG